MQQVKYHCLFWPDNPLHKSQRLSRTPTPGMRIPLWVIGKDHPRDSQDIIGSCCCMWSLPEVKAKTLLLKTVWTSDTGHGGPEMDLAQKPSPWGLTSMEGTMKSCKGGKQTTVDAYERPQQPAWHSNSRGEIEVRIPWWLDLRSAQQEGNSA